MNLVLVYFELSIFSETITSAYIQNVNVFHEMFAQYLYQQLITISSYQIKSKETIINLTAMPLIESLL